MVHWFFFKFSTGVYIGFDNPKTLGKFETGSKAALPIFKDFVENAYSKKILMISKYLKIYF